MRVYHFGNLTLQLYLGPQLRRVKGGYNLVLRTAITLSKNCLGVELLGFGFGIGYFPPEPAPQNAKSTGESVPGEKEARLASELEKCNKAGLA